MKQHQYGGSESLSDLNVIYALFLQSGVISILLLLLPLLLLLGIGDECHAAPNIHRDTHVMVDDGPQAAVPYKNKRQENLAVSCTYIMKYYECYPTDLYSYRWVPLKLYSS